jgi:hypothetical protein
MSHMYNNLTAVSEITTYSNSFNNMSMLQLQLTTGNDQGRRTVTSLASSFPSRQAATPKTPDRQNDNRVSSAKLTEHRFKEGC